MSEPNTVDEALSCSEKENWKETMKGEFQSLCENQVWDLVPPPRDCKVINSSGVRRCFSLGGLQMWDLITSILLHTIGG